MSRLSRRVALTIFVCVSMVAARAEPLTRDDREKACWQQHSRERTRAQLSEPTLVDFSNLRSGYAVRSPLRIDFSVRGMGVVPAGKPNSKAGHHHLLIDTPLPLDVGRQIPFNEGHRHFGKAQTGTVIELPAGLHRLRLLFADHEHRPYYVYSPEITIDVLGPRGSSPVSIDGGCGAWYEEEMSRPRPAGTRILFGNVRDGEAVTSPLNLRFLADGLGVAPNGQGGAGLGHFVLDISRAGLPVQQLDLSNGATQANLFLPIGVYQLRLRMFDDGRARELAPAAEISLNVVSQERL
jgi:hypothetical protein